MCGIITFVSNDQSAATQQALVRDSMECTQHPAPEHAELWSDGDAIIASHPSVVGSLTESPQPEQWGPHDAPQRYTFVGQGEIYNSAELRGELQGVGAEFTNEGSGEVIVAAYHHWGPQAVTRFRGMFTFLVWDAVDRKLFGARDPFGVKPLCMTSTADGIAFSSDPLALRKFTNKTDVDPTALQDYLIFQYVPEPRHIDYGVDSIESGCYFTVAPGERVVIQRYFEPQLIARPTTSTEEKGKLYRRIADSLDAAVKTYSQADVPVGAFLSGGIDSTAIVALAKRYIPDLVTFTTGFEREGFSEIDVAAESAQALGVQHIVRSISEQEFTQQLPRIIWHLADPIADPALVPLYFVAEEAAKHVSVVFSGEGADELFGGYNIYREAMSLKWMTSLPSPIRRALAAVGRALPGGMRGKDMLRRGALDLEERYYGNARIFRQDQLADVLHTFDSSRTLRDVTDPIYEQSRGWDPIARMQHIDLFTWMRGDILVQADRMTSAHGLQLRAPFLDDAVFDVAKNVPPELKITRSTSKFALRAALADIVPPHVLQRRKLGFPVPIRHYLAEGSYEWARDIIQSAETDEFLDSRVALQLLDAHRAGDADNSRQIWTLLVFMLWHGIFVTESINPQQIP